MTETTARIRWEDGQWGNLVGYVGTLEPWAFQIWHIVIDGHWSLVTSLPEHQTPISTSADPEKLKGRAEEWLAGFTASLGAIFSGTLRETVSTERDAHLKQADETGDCPHAWRPETSCGAARALGWVLDEMEAGQ